MRVPAVPADAGELVADNEKPVHPRWLGVGLPGAARLPYGAGPEAFRDLVVECRPTDAPDHALLWSWRTRHGVTPPAVARCRSRPRSAMWGCRLASEGGPHRAPPTDAGRLGRPHYVPRVARRAARARSVPRIRWKVVR